MRLQYYARPEGLAEGQQDSVDLPLQIAGPGADWRESLSRLFETLLEAREHLAAYLTVFGHPLGVPETPRIAM